MNLTPLGLIVAVSLTSLGTVACSGGGDPGPDSDPSSTQEDLVGSPGAASTSSEASTDGRCVQRELCARDSHWDRRLCACVPDGCVQTRACAINTHWDTKRCVCVPVECIKAPCP